MKTELTQDEAIELAYAWASQVADDVVDGNNLLEAIRDVLKPFVEPPAYSRDDLHSRKGG